MKAFALAMTVAAVSVIGALPAAAQDAEKTGVYGNLGYSFVDAGSGFKFGAATARIGGRVHEYFGVEAEGAIGVDGDDITLSGVRVKTKLKHSLNAYAVGFLPLGENFDLLARGGYGTTKIKATATGVGGTASGSDESWNYGVGAQYLFDGKNGLRADYTRFDFGSGNEDADVWSLSYVRKF